jgi:uncharacterized membrane protein YhaH (DUF805 family)
MKWYLQVFKNYAAFNGRARRKEYWIFVLFNLIFLIMAAILDNLLGTTFDNIFGIAVKMNSGLLGSQVSPSGFICLIYNLVVLIPGIAVSVRRLHDVGDSGWMLLIVLIPIIGAIWLLVLMASDSKSGQNQYGQNPKKMTVN